MKIRILSAAATFLFGAFVPVAFANAQELIVPVSMTPEARALVGEVLDCPKRYAEAIPYRPGTEVSFSEMVRVMYQEEIFTIPACEIGADVWHYISFANFGDIQKVSPVPGSVDFLSRDDENIFFTVNATGNPTFVVVTWEKGFWSISTVNPLKLKGLKAGTHFFVRHVHLGENGQD